jgi:hypothetical protein
MDVVFLMHKISLPFVFHLLSWLLLWALAPSIFLSIRSSRKSNISAACCLIYNLFLCNTVTAECAKVPLLTDNEHKDYGNPICTYLSLPKMTLPFHSLRILIVVSLNALTKVSWKRWPVFMCTMLLEIKMLIIKKLLCSQFKNYLTWACSLYSTAFHICET